MALAAAAPLPAAAAAGEGGAPPTAVGEALHTGAAATAEVRKAVAFSVGITPDAISSGAWVTLDAILHGVGVAPAAVSALKGASPRDFPP